MLSLAALQCSLVLTGSRAASTSQRAATSMLTQDELKKMVGYKAVDDYVKSGMKIGLGTGSTAAFAVERVGELLKSGALAVVRGMAARGIKPSVGSYNAVLTVRDEDGGEAQRTLLAFWFSF